jgi:hypothetical protein
MTNKERQAYEACAVIAEQAAGDLPAEAVVVCAEIARRIRAAVPAREEDTRVIDLDA